MSKRANALADRIEQGAQALATFAAALSDAEWNTVVPNENRTVGIEDHALRHSFHHLANIRAALAQ